MKLTTFIFSVALIRGTGAFFRPPPSSTGKDAITPALVI